MALSSMTGFARGHGVCGTYNWSWELKSVNAKGLDLRLRVPPGWDAVEVPARNRATAVISRGTVYGTLTVERKGAAPVVRVNEPVLTAVLATIKDLAGRVDAAPPRIDGILSLKGVIEVVDDDEHEQDRRTAEVDVIDGFDRTLVELVAMRRHEGAALGIILIERIDQIARLTKGAEEAPGRQPEAIKARISEQIATLLEVSDRFDPDRLHQEAILVATKADIREELDRLTAHAAQVRHLIQEGGAIGRRLDFLAQEFNREVNTLCAKSNDADLTKIGLDLKSAVEQFREQVQNLE
jgi:uncharacterized protein (TIGR00255 family)